MKITKHIAFHKVVDAPLWNYVREHNIKVDADADSDIVSFDIYTCDEHWPWIEKYNIQHQVVFTSDLEFSKEELRAAPWLCVRSIWRTGYPQPTHDYAYKHITYTCEDMCDHCSVGLRQVSPFRLNKVPAWGRRHFFSLFWVEDELFVSDAVKEAFQNECISGISFLPVQNKAGATEYEGIWQLAISGLLPGAIVPSETFLKKTAVCPVCGTAKYCQNGCGQLRLRADAFENAPDIVKTEEYFGGMPGIAAREMIVSQKVYRTIVEHKLDRSLLFYPVELVY